MQTNGIMNVFSNVKIKNKKTWWIV